MEPILHIIKMNGHLVVLNELGMPVCPNICIHNDEKMQKLVEQKSERQIAAYVFTLLAAEFNDQAQRLLADWN